VENGRATVAKPKIAFSQENGRDAIHTDRL
jgi:hypothetical protein